MSSTLPDDLTSPGFPTSPGMPIFHSPHPSSPPAQLGYIPGPTSSPTPLPNNPTHTSLIPSSVRQLSPSLSEPYTDQLLFGPNWRHLTPSTSAPSSSYRSATLSDAPFTPRVDCSNVPWHSELFLRLNTGYYVPSYSGHDNTQYHKHPLDKNPNYIPPFVGADSIVYFVAHDDSDKLVKHTLDDFRGIIRARKMRELWNRFSQEMQAQNEEDARVQADVQAGRAARATVEASSSGASTPRRSARINNRAGRSQMEAQRVSNRQPSSRPPHSGRNSSNSGRQPSLVHARPRPRDLAFQLAEAIQHSGLRGRNTLRWRRAKQCISYYTGETEECPKSGSSWKSDAEAEVKMEYALLFMAGDGGWDESNIRFGVDNTVGESDLQLNPMYEVEV